MKKLNVQAAWDGKAAGRHGGAPREHLFVFESLGNFLQYCIYNTYFNIKSKSIIKLHFSQRNNMIFSKD